MTKTTNQINPTQKEERINFLDVLRGIAIQFIFMANIVYLSGLFDFPETYRYPSTLWPTDNILYFITYILIDGKFYSIFSLLFGIGCLIQFRKLKENNKPFTSFFKRRMFWLLIFGLIHLVGLWVGDILTLYALLGLLLIPFVNLTNKKLLWFAGILIMMPILNWVIIHGLKLDYAEFIFQKNIAIWEHYGYPIAEYDGNKINDFKFYISNTNWSDFFKMNFGNALLRFYMILEEGRMFKVFGIFLIGLWTGRKILDHQLLTNIKFLKKVSLIGICVGLPMSILRTVMTFSGDQSNLISFLKTLSYALGTVPFALGYVALIAIIYSKKPKVLDWIAPAGKMAFTNYISQTIISIIIFYGLGFNFAGKFGFTLIMLITISIFLCQVLFSTLWLKKFKFGPLEWVWRQLTYNKKITNKK